VNKTLSLTASESSAKLVIGLNAKKFKAIGSEVMLCRGQIPLAKLTERPIVSCLCPLTIFAVQESQKLKVLLHTPSDNVQLAVMFIKLQKVGFHCEEDCAQGLSLIQSLSNNFVAQISQLHVQENKRDYGDEVLRLQRTQTSKKERSLGNIFDLHSMELASATKKLIECLDPVVDVYEGLLNLFHLRDPYKSTLFLITLSLAILHFEAAVALGLVGIVFFIQYNAYYRRVYEPHSITIVRNAQFMIVLISLITDSVSMVETFERNVLYWGKPDQTLLTMNIFLFGSVIVYLSLVLLPLRWTLVAILWLGFLKNSEFFNTLGLSTVRRLQRIDWHAVKAKSEQIVETQVTRVSKNGRLIVFWLFQAYEWPLRPLCSLLWRGCLGAFHLVDFLVRWGHRRYAQRAEQMQSPATDE